MSKGSYKKRVGQFIRNEKLSIVPAPNRVLIKITQKQLEDLISKEIVKDDGTKARLFFEPIRFDAGFDRAYSQNVSVGTAIGVGSDVHNIKVGDIVILDYLATTLVDDTIGFVNGDQLISIIAHTTYHETSSPLVNGRRAWAKGDFDHISRILGLVRGDKLIPFDPYVFIEYNPDVTRILNLRGEKMKPMEGVREKEVIAAPENSIFKCGDKVRIKSEDPFEREVGGRTISIVFKSDILCKTESHGKILSE